MRYRDGRRSVCVSSQSGCPLTCTFCATGQMRFGRNLTAGEILDQALHFRRIEPIDHLVFMGMGEPMMNLDAVLEAARRLPDLGVTHRRTTISTVGWLPGLRRFVDEVEEPIRLALSLHAPDDALRSTLMPVNDRYPLADVLAECRRYVELRGRKVFVEYVMLAGVNDRPEHAEALAKLLDPKAFKVNLIPYNPTGRFDGSLARGDRGVQGGARPRAACRRRCGSRAAARSPPRAGSSAATTADSRRVRLGRGSNPKEAHASQDDPDARHHTHARAGRLRPRAAEAEEELRSPHDDHDRGDDHDDNERPTTTVGRDTTTSRHTSSGRSRPRANCKQLCDLGSQFSQPLTGANGDIAKQAALLRRSRTRRPRTSGRTSRRSPTRFTQIAGALKGVDLNSGKMPDAATLAKMMKLGSRVPAARSSRRRCSTSRPGPTKNCTRRLGRSGAGPARRAGRALALRSQLLLELERRRVDAVPDAGRVRPVREHVSEVAAAARRTSPRCAPCRSSCRSPRRSPRRSPARRRPASRTPSRTSSRR